MKRLPGTISVVVPAYNLESRIGATLRSVLAQTSLPNEVVVVDDGSTDGTAEAVGAVQSMAPPGLIRLYSIPNSGPGAARNRGIAEARGEWIAFLDGDDLWLPEKIARVRAAIALDGGAGIIAHDLIEVGLDGTESLKLLHRYHDPSQPLLPQLYRGCFLSTSSLAVRVEALEAVGGFDPSLRSAQDYDLWLKLARNNRLLFIPEALEKYILRRGNISSNTALRVRCLILIAWRHAPSLVPLVGRLSAALLWARSMAVASVIWSRGELAKLSRILCFEGR